MDGADRLKKILTVDKRQDPTKLKRLIESDIKNVLAQYLELDDLGVECDIDVDVDGIHLNIYARAKRAKIIGTLPLA